MKIEREEGREGARQTKRAAQNDQCKGPELGLSQAWRLQLTRAERVVEVLQGRRYWKDVAVPLSDGATREL